MADKENKVAPASNPEVGNTNLQKSLDTLQGDHDTLVDDFGKIEDTNAVLSKQVADLQAQLKAETDAKADVQANLDKSVEDFDALKVSSESQAKSLKELMEESGDKIPVIGMKNHVCRLTFGKKGKKTVLVTTIVKDKVTTISREEYNRLTNPKLPKPIVTAYFPMVKG